MTVPGSSLVAAEIFLNGDGGRETLQFFFLEFILELDELTTDEYTCGQKD